MNDTIFDDSILSADTPNNTEQAAFTQQDDCEAEQLLKNNRISKEKIKKQFDKLMKKAKKLVEDKDALSTLLHKAVALCDELSHLRLIGKHFTDISLAISMIDDYIWKRYTEVPKATIITLVAALLYFLTPFDVIPDTLPIIGYADDMLVFSSVLSAAKRDISKYRQWKESNEQENPKS